MKIGAHFTGAELTTTSQPIANEPSDAEWAALGRLVALILDPLREALGRPVRVTSGFRSPAVNRAVGGASTSQHLRGEAADIKVDGLTTTEVARTIHRLRLPVDQCIVERGDGGWVHVSTRLDGKNRGQYLASPKAGQYDPWSP
jgi:hypothetical protein